MPINTTAQITFSNEIVRPGADKLAQAYNRGKDLVTRFNALGSDQTALDIMRGEFRDVATSFKTAYLTSVLTRDANDAGNSPIPNTTDAVEDGAPGDGRPQVDGQEANTLIGLAGEFANWLKTGTADGTGNQDLGLRRTLVVALLPAGDITLSHAQNFVTVINTITGDYEASSNTKLNQILAVAARVS